MTANPSRTMDEIAAAVAVCRVCPRLVSWREVVASDRRAVFAGQTYWARPLAGFGDIAAELVVVGLAPAAHGGNRTGRVFTGDRSGDFLFAALHRAGYANQPTSTGVDDGLQLTGAFVTAAVRCAPPGNRPTPAERDACAPYLVQEFDALKRTRVVLALGAFAFDAVIRLAFAAARPKARFGHAVELPLPNGTVLLGSYHPSQRNVFTGLLTAEMFDAVLGRARELAG